MTAETTRRGFLQGLMGALVISALPKGVAKAIDVDYDPFTIEAPRASSTSGCGLP